jgi:hypothetical protein
MVLIFLAATTAGFRATSATVLPDSQTLRVTIDLRDVRIQSFFGLGIQWDPYSYPPLPEAWSLTLKRLNYARPAFFRVMLGAHDYWRGFDATNAPLYVWTEGEPEIRKRLGSLLDILNYAQSRNIDVLLGEWSPPGRLGNGTNDIISRPDDPRWARLIADYVAQVAQAGWMGACAWDLDDAMHTVNGNPPIPNDKTLKVWGFWNTQGTAMGHPGDEDMRPWFYTWSLMSRLFPQGTRILTLPQPDLPHLRILAGLAPSSGILTVMLVNNTDKARRVTVCVPGAGRRTLLEYHYFEADHPMDADGFAAPNESIPEAGLETGVSIAMPSRGTVFLSMPP